MGSCWFSQPWPNQQSCLDTLNLLDEQRSFGGGKIAWSWWHIWMGPNVKRFTCYLWRWWEPLLFMIWIWSFDLGLFRLGFLLLFSRVSVLLSTGCSREGIPPLPLRGLLGELYFLLLHIQAWGQAPFPSLSIISIAEYCFVAGCCSGGLLTPLPGLFLRRGCLPFLERSARNISGLC